MKLGREFENKAVTLLQKAAYGRAIGESWLEISLRLKVEWAELKALAILCPQDWRRCVKRAREIVKLQAATDPNFFQRGPRIVQIEP